MYHLHANAAQLLSLETNNFVLKREMGLVGRVFPDSAHHGILDGS